MSSRHDSGDNKVERGDEEGVDGYLVREREGGGLDKRKQLDPEF